MLSNQAALLHINSKCTNLEELDADDGEHELEEERDEHDVADGLDGDDDALHHVLEALGPVDGAQGAQHAQHAEDLHHGDGAGAAARSWTRLDRTIISWNTVKGFDAKTD